MEEIMLGEKMERIDEEVANAELEPEKLKGTDNSQIHVPYSFIRTKISFEIHGFILKCLYQ